MVKVSFPSLWFPAFKFRKGQLLNVSILGIGLKIPPIDITFWNAFKILNGFTILDTDWISNPIINAMSGIAHAVWDIAKGTLDSWADEFYEKHCTYEEYVREREFARKEEK